MDICAKSVDEAFKKYVGAQCHKILYIDLTADIFKVLKVDDTEWKKKEEEQPSQKISDWFVWFADSSFCHDNDKERFKKFTDLNTLKTALGNADSKPLSLVYRRKFDLSEMVYSTVSMELHSFRTDDDHIGIYLFIRNITTEIQDYNLSLQEDIDVQNYTPGKKTLLIVEDNEINREILSDILSDEYRTLQAENGAIGLELLQKHMMEISVVILDVQMPVMNGYQVLEAVKRDPFLSKIPIIVATGSDNAEEERICLELGASDFVSKPYNPDIIKSRISNIIRLKESAATMSILQTDERTGLYTLQAFYYHAKQVIKNEPDKKYCLTIFDVDHFKQINESYGEETGDQILHQIADVIKNYTAGSDIYGRFGAARFLLMRESLSEDAMSSWIDDLFSALKAASSVKRISFKAGIYNNIDKTLSIPIICDRAITALNSVGQSFDKRYACYDEKHAAVERRLSMMEADMRDAYEKGQFSVYYQPKHDTQTGKLLGAEALIRWIHPGLGFLSPGEFIPLFERNGFISYADYYVLNRTCANMRKWIDEGITLVPISVNASRRDFDRDNFLEIVQKPLSENNIDPSLIHIEVTESMFSDRLDEIEKILHQCREAGFKIELDDFGAGYSSLTTLAALSLDVMKLDMSFMRNYKDERKLKVLSACINLAKNLDLKTVCEGVENEEQVALLKEYGCDLIQGYYFSKPIPEDEFRKYLLKYSSEA